MHWDNILGHQRQRQLFETALAVGRLGSAFLFVGREGIGKRTFARMLAQSLLCRNTPSNKLKPCGQCEDCAQVQASSHPDLIEVAKPEEKSALPLELLIGKEENRMRAGLCYEIHLRPFAGRRKIAIIDDADTLNDEGANALLKLLEEPPPDSILILIATSLQKQLPTIRSRCQTILFQPLEMDLLIELILKNHLTDDRDDAQEIAASSDGSIALAGQLSDPQFHEFRRWLLGELPKRPLEFITLGEECLKQVNSAGKEGSFKRERLKNILRLTANYYRMLSLCQVNIDDKGMTLTKTLDDLYSSSLQKALQGWSRGLTGAVSCWQSCLRAIDQVDRNVNHASLIQFWTAELAEQSGR